MTATAKKILFDDLAKQLAPYNFFTVRDLYNLKFFGSEHAIRLAMREGRLGFVQISRRRRLIPRELLLEFLRNNITSPGDCK